MPIADPGGYDSGHFARVYEHLLRPSIAAAGYTPIRSDDAVKTDYIVVSVIQKIVESDIVICDLSGRNPNVMYELGVRHAFGKPVVLIKDKLTEKCFDIQGLRYTEYDETLRIDTVQKDISRITAAIRETADSKPDEVNSIVRLAGIKTADAPVSQVVSADTALVLSSIAALERLVQSAGITTRPQAPFFIVRGGGVVLPDNEEVGIGDHIYNNPGNLIGELIDIHPATNKIFIRRESGKVEVFSGDSIISKDLTTMPF